jgi:hypothetical protein
MALGVAVVLGSALVSTKVHAAAAKLMAHSNEVDPLPQPLPNHWVLGMTVAVFTDAHDDFWIIHRNDSPKPCEVYGTSKPPGASETERA